MARVSTYLNLPGNTEQAFAFYRTVFQTDYASPVMRFKDAPAGGPPLSQEEQDLVLHVALPTLGGHLLMGTDAVASKGFVVQMGNHVHINLEPDTRVEAERLFLALAEGGQVEMPLQDMFWGAYFGSLVDRWGVRWMVNCGPKEG